MSEKRSLQFEYLRAELMSSKKETMRKTGQLESQNACRGNLKSSWFLTVFNFIYMLLLGRHVHFEVKVHQTTCFFFQKENANV